MDPPAQALRGVDAPALVPPKHRNGFCSALCDVQHVCRQHLHFNKDTVQVPDRLREKKDVNITKLLQTEKPKNLITVKDMKFINIFFKALGKPSFPYIEFSHPKSRNIKYAIPQMRDDLDRSTCPASLANLVQERLGCEIDTVYY